MGGGSGGSGSGGRKGGGGGQSEAQLQARVDRMNVTMGKLDESIKAKKVGIANLERELSRYSERDRGTKEIRTALEKNIKTGQKKINTERRRLLNINNRFEKILSENS
jgi:predicted RNase H-like nuclease (RuvC/YqgF family)